MGDSFVALTVTRPITEDAIISSGPSLFDQDCLNAIQKAQNTWSSSWATRDAPPPEPVLTEILHGISTDKRHDIFIKLPVNNKVLSLVILDQKIESTELNALPWVSSIEGGFEEIFDLMLSKNGPSLSEVSIQCAVFKVRTTMTFLSTQLKRRSRQDNC